MFQKQWMCERCGRFFTNIYELKHDGLSIGDIFVHGPDECGPVTEVVQKGYGGLSSRLRRPPKGR